MFKKPAKPVIQVLAVKEETRVVITSESELYWGSESHESKENQGKGQFHHRFIH
jgi:hypothetical protein